MIGTNVTHKGSKAIVLAARWFPDVGDTIAIQYLSPNGMPYRVRDRPKGFRQYIYVKPDEVIGVDS